MTDPTPASPQNANDAARDAGSAPNRFGKLALVAAGVLALGAVGVSAWRAQHDGNTPPLPEPTGAVQQQPSLEQEIAALEAKLKTDPENADAWKKLGWAYFGTQRYAEAATALKRSTALDPKNADTFSFLGEALVMSSKADGKMPRDARLAFEKALQLDPKDARARYFRAVAMDLDGRHLAAIDAWFDLMADTPEDAPYAQDIRQVIVDVAKASKIDIDKRLAAASFAPPASGMKTSGSQMAAAGIPGPTRDQIQAASQLPQGQQEAMIRGMVDGLEARLKTQPQDAKGWAMLMRSRMQLGEPAKAAKALQDGLAAFKNDTAATRQLREAAATLGVPAQ